MALPSEVEVTEAPSSSRRELASGASRDSRALRILAKTIYRELRSSGLSEEDVMAVSGEMLHLVAVDVRDRRAPRV